MFDRYRQKRQIEVTFSQRLDRPLLPGTRIEMADGSLYQIKRQEGMQATIERVRWWDRVSLLAWFLIALLTVACAAAAYQLPPKN